MKKIPLTAGGFGREGRSMESITATAAVAVVLALAADLVVEERSEISATVPAAVHSGEN